MQFPGFIELRSVDSTNNYALDLTRAKNLTERQAELLHGTTVFAHEQWQGKGQRGKSWAAAPGENLHMSVIIAPQPRQLQQQFTLSAVIALAVRQFFAEKSSSDIFIKWPNDIYFQDRKAGGILIENVISGAEWKWAVIGIGLNVNQTVFDPDLPNPVSLKQITGKDYVCLELAKELSAKVFERIEKCKSQITDCRLQVADYNAHLYKRGEKVRLKKDSRVFEAVIKEVTPTGQLLVEHGTEERFDFGEMIWLI